MRKFLLGVIVMFISLTIEGAAILAVWNLNIAPLFHQRKITFLMAMGASVALSLISRILKSSHTQENTDELTRVDAIEASLADHAMVAALILSAWVLSWFI